MVYVMTAQNILTPTTLWTNTVKNIFEQLSLTLSPLEDGRSTSNLGILINSKTKKWVDVKHNLIQTALLNQTNRIT